MHTHTHTHTHTHIRADTPKCHHCYPCPLRTNTRTSTVAHKAAEMSKQDLPWPMHLRDARVITPAHVRHPFLCLLLSCALPLRLVFSLSRALSLCHLPFLSLLNVFCFSRFWSLSLSLSLNFYHIISCLATCSFLLTLSFARHQPFSFFQRFSGFVCSSLSHFLSALFFIRVHRWVVNAIGLDVIFENLAKNWRGPCSLFPPFLRI